jgi:hypothetical protein
MKKKTKCMADGGMPKERNRPAPEPAEWQKSLAAALQAISGNREAAKEKPPTADSLGDTARRIKDRGAKLREIDSYANGGMPGQVDDFQAGVKPMAFRTGITPPNMVPTEAQGLAAYGSLVDLGGGGASPAAVTIAPAVPGNVFKNPSAGNMLTPSGGAQTMAEKARAAGIDPTAAYRPGSAQDPHASGFSGPTAAQRIAGSNATAAALGPNQPTPQISNPLEMIRSRQQRQMSRTPGLADGGRIQPNLMSPSQMYAGVKEAIVDPIAADWKQGNRAIKGIREQYPTADNIAGLHPGVAAAQVANDVMAGDMDGGTAINAAQAVPIVKRLTGMAGLVAKGREIPIVGGRMAVNMPATLKKNAILTAGQTLGHPANAFADGGAIYKFEGKGGPRDDQIPVTVAGEKIKVSDGEEAVILPAKTAGNPQAIAAIGQVIEQSNDGRKPAMGVSDGGKYEAGAYPYDGKKPPTAQEVYAPFYAGARAAFPNTADALSAASAATQQAADQGLYGAAAGQAARGVITGGIGLANDVAERAGALLDTPANVLKTFVTGDNAPAREPRSAQVAAPSKQTPAPSGSEGRNSAIVAANNLPDPRIAQNTGNAGDAWVDPATGNLHFTQKGFDPTKMAVSNGAGAITSTATGRTIAIPPRAPEQAPDNRPRDAHGNDMTRTLELRDQIMRARADRAWSNATANNPAYHQEGMDQLQALADMGALDSEATKRVALRQQQQREAETAAVLQEKGRGEVADSAAARIARQGLGAAYDSGDQDTINRATLKAIAAGVLSQPKPSSPYEIKTDPLGNQTRLNSSTGMSETLDRATNTWRPIGSAEQIPEFASESDARSAQKAGKIKVGQKVMIGGRVYAVNQD